MEAMRALMVDPTENNSLAVGLREHESGAGALIFPWLDIRIAYTLIPDGRVGVAAIFAVG